MEEAARALGLGVRETLALMCFDGAGGRVELRCLREELPVTSVGASRVANALEERGLVERVVPREDRRRVELWLTDAGWDAMEAIAGGFGSEGKRVAARDSTIAEWRCVAELQRELGLSEGQARCLLALRGLGDGWATASQVAASAHVKRTTAAMALSRLEERGLAEASPADGVSRYRAA